MPGKTCRHDNRHSFVMLVLYNYLITLIIILITFGAES